MRPYVQVAAVCQTALQEPTGILSLIRITDRINLVGLTEEMRPHPLNQFALAVLMKSGPMKGKYKWKVECESPSGKVTPVTPGPPMTALFEGDEHGIKLVIPLAIVAEEEGLYWFNVVLEEDLLTRIPLRILYQKVAGLPGMQTQPPQS
jgi:hypothetical protein